MRARDQEPASTSRSQPRQVPTRAASPVPMAAHPAMPLAPPAILHLQRTIGNAAVACLIDAQQQPHSRGHDQPVQRSTVPDVLRSPGHPLDDDTRTEMEARLGADFSDVRLHTDTAAQDSAAEVGARAYTSGKHVVIGDGGGDVHTLAHELTHVLQQRRGPVAGTDTGTGLRISDPRDRFEREAEDNARQALSRSAPPTEAHRAGTDIGTGQGAGGRQESETDRVAVQRTIGPDHETPPELITDTQDQRSADNVGDEWIMPGRVRDAAPGGRGPLPAGSVLAMQQRVGNAAVGRSLSQAELSTTGVPRSAQQPRPVAESPQNSYTAMQAPSSTAPFIQRVPPGGDKKRKRAPDQRPLTDFKAFSTSLYAEKERADATDKRGRFNMFKEALYDNFHKSGDWNISRDMKYAIRENQGTSELHNYKNEPEVESLRWISTVVKRYLSNSEKEPGEVQAAIGGGGELIIAANSKAANEYLVTQLGSGGRAFISTALETEPLTGEQFEKEWTKGFPFKKEEKEAAVGREVRHFEGLRLVHRQQDAKASERYKKVLDAIGEHNVVVADGGDDGMHAERRIKIYNGNVTPNYLAGTKRPCGTCFSVLYPGTSKEDLDRSDAVRPGVFFFSKAANSGVWEYGDDRSRTPSQKAKSLFEQINRNVPRTYLSMARNGATVRENGSDSEDNS